MSKPNLTVAQQEKHLQSQQQALDIQTLSSMIDAHQAQRQKPTPQDPDRSNLFGNGRFDKPRGTG